MSITDTRPDAVTAQEYCFIVITTNARTEGANSSPASALQCVDVARVAAVNFAIE